MKEFVIEEGSHWYCRDKNKTYKAVVRQKIGHRIFVFYYFSKSKGGLLMDSVGMDADKIFEVTKELNPEYFL